MRGALLSFSSGPIDGGLQVGEMVVAWVIMVAWMREVEMEIKT